MNNDIPYPSHFMYLFLHYRTDNPLVDKMQKDVLIFTGNSERKIGIKDGTDIEYILNSKFNPLEWWQPGMKEYYLSILKKNVHNF